MKYLKYIVLILMLFLISNCDLEKLSNYKYDNDPIPESAKIYGTLINKYTFSPVAGAHISIHNQSTISDKDGNYVLYYHYIEDEDRNQPVSIRFTQEEYLTVDSSFVIFPENEINAFLPYASPEIRRIGLVDTIGICQAIVHDYQGFNDIASVEVHLAYRVPGEKYPSLYTRMQMERVMTDSIRTNYYQVFAPVSMQEHGNLMNVFDVYAVDRLKYSDTMSSMELAASDSILFPIVTK